MGSPVLNLPTFRPPTPEELAANPSYQFRLKSGEDALQRAAAAKGVLRTGGTLKDLMGYGQDFASQEYENAYDRALRQYGLESEAAKAKYGSEWDQYVFANTPRGGGGGGDYDIPPPPMAPEVEDPGADPYANIPDVKRRNPKFPGYDPYY